MATCDTCGRVESKDVRFYETQVLMICCDCYANRLLIQNVERKTENSRFKDLVGYSTKDIYNYLSKSVVGQDRAKKTLSIALYNHLKRIVSTIKLEKNNVLLIGSTGTGKTLLVKEIANFSSLPVGFADANRITQHGWLGEDPETVLKDLYDVCEGDVKKVESGIVFIDEIDKLNLQADGRNKEGNAQRGLLKILEGSVVGLEVKKDTKVFINTTNILFICAGAFPDLKDIIKNRADTNTIGFNSEAKKPIDLYENGVTTEDLETYGFMSEFLGRIPIRTVLEDLDINQLRLILTKPEDSLVTQYTEIFSMDGIKLEFSSTGLEEIAKQAYELQTGARGLKTILEKVLFDYQYEYGGNELYITKDIVLEKLGIKKASDIQVDSKKLRLL
jgi:ATP-dependent Clp protease ATP-binding subunit ClpX